MVINVNPTTKSNLVAVAVACAKKRLEMRLVPALGGLQTLELYDMGCLVSSSCTDDINNSRYELFDSDLYFSENYIPFQEEQYYYNTGVVDGGYYDLLIDFCRYEPAKAQLMWRCKCIDGKLHASDDSGRTWELRDWRSYFAIRPHNTITPSYGLCASTGFEISPDMSFMELLELCVMSKPRKEFREDGSGFGSHAHGARELKNKTIDGSTVYVFDGGYNGEVTVRIGKYFEHPTEGIRWDDTHQGTFFNQPYLLNILSRAR